MRCRSMKIIAGASVSGTTTWDSQILSYSVFGCIGCLYDFTDGITHLFGRYQGVSWRKNIGGAKPLVDRSGNGALNARSDFRQLERMFKHHGHRSDGADRIRLACSRNIGCRAMYRLVESNSAANASRGQHAETSREHSAFVAQDISEDV